MASELKYTDRDVRDNKAHVTEIVTDFLEDYTGEFQFLIDCKMRMAQGMDLSVGMMRGVLNCMRADPRVNFDLPDPLPIEESNVVPIKKSQRKWGPETCELAEREIEHRQHYIGDENEFKRRHYCHGWYWINRDPRGYYFDAKVRPDWVGIVARTGAMIHRLNGDAHVLWRPNAHEPGFHTDPEIAYQTCCKGASVIRGGYLLKQEHIFYLLQDRSTLDKLIENQRGYPLPPSQRKKLIRCPRCFD